MKGINNCEVSFVNLTPHAICVMGEGGEAILTIPPSGTVARVSSSTEVVARLGGIDVVKAAYGPVENLPEPSEGTIYIVSMLVGQIAAGRDDVVGPDTSPASVVRDPEGKIAGVKRFQRF